MKLTQFRTNYLKMKELGLLDVVEYAKLSSDGFMDLSVDVLQRHESYYDIALAHYGEQNGDLMADPDMVIRVYPDRGEVEALTFQNDYLGIYHEVYTRDGEREMCRPRLKKDLNEFLNMWLTNLIEQGFHYSV